MPCLKLGPAAVLLFATALCSLAQDVTVAPLQWTYPASAPEDLPVIKSAPRISFPTELRTTPDPGYVVAEMIIDAKGKRLWGSRAATTPALERIYDLQMGEFFFTAGKREGKPVNSSVQLAVLFNPASAPAAGPDATPRLLEVSLVRLPAPKNREARASGPPQEVIMADITVDVTGQISAIKNVPAEHAAAIGIAAKNWRFAPARRAGQAIEAGLRVPFVLTRGHDEAGGDKRLPPRVVYQEPPRYPWIMRASGMRGDVVVDFIVDIEGRVRNPFVVRTLNPSFDDAAIDAVRKWRFEPGRAGERPVTTHMQVPIVFRLNETADGGEDGLRVARKPDLSKLPEEFRYDTAPKLIGAARPVFPYALLKAGKEGRATVRFLVDEKGRVVDTAVNEATSPEFAAALTAAVELFAYEPAIKGGRPSRALLAFGQEFQRDEGYQLVSPEDRALLRREEKKPETILGTRDLDAAPKPLSRRAPRFPLGIGPDISGGEATIEFIIDEEGRARLPRVLQTTHDAFGYAAVQAIATWRFEAPTRGGRATVVRVQIPVQFTRPTPKP